MRGQQQAINTRIGIERLDDRVSLHRVRRTVEAHVRHTRHMLLEEVVLDDIDHLSYLAENEHAVLRDDAGGGLFGFDEFALAAVERRGSACANAAIL